MKHTKKNQNGEQPMKTVVGVNLFFIVIRSFTIHMLSDGVWAGRGDVKWPV